MNHFVLHPEAYADLNEIWEYVAADNLDAADRVLDEIYESLTPLARFPHQGHSRLDLTSRPLKFRVVRDYVIAYTLDEKPAGRNCHSARSAQSSCTGGNTEPRD
jgi:plasmid stabilization system protein ParE